MSFYDTDLAFIHDDGFGFHARGAAPAILQRFADHGIDDGTVLDLGAGSGIWARELLDAGYAVHGIDHSKAMIRIAKRRAPEARFVHGSFFDVDFPRCVAATSLGECIGYLADPRGNLTTITRLFKRVYTALERGGLFILDLAAPGRGRGQPMWVDREDWAIMYRPEEKGRILTRHMTTFVRSGKSFRRVRETHRLRLYTKTEVLTALRRAGFRARTMPTYGYEPWPHALVAYVARKP